MREADPKLVDFELDLYWAAYADQNPLALFAKYPGRFAMWHVKDMQVVQGTKSMAPVGQGTLDFKSMFAHAGESGMKHFFVEHDTAATVPGGPLASIQTSYANLRQLLS
jgi:sugar phosphate isomerase/epimerase